MHLYEAVAAIAAAAILLALVTRPSKAKSAPVIEERVHLSTTTASSLFLAIIAMAGLVFLSSENLMGIRYHQQTTRNDSFVVQDPDFGACAREKGDPCQARDASSAK